MTARQSGLLAIGMGFLLVWAALLWSSPTSTACIQEQRQETTEKYSKEGQPNFIVALFDGASTAFICSGDLIDANDGVVTAVATGFIAYFTFTLWFVTDKSASATLATVETMRDAERAYVKMSHKAPGVIWPGVVANDRYRLEVQIKNFGRTPASVTNVFLRQLVLKKHQVLPKQPNYRMRRHRQAAKAFLVADDHFTYFTAFAVHPKTVTKIRKAERLLMIYGYVDYIDRFGARHRSGYGRVYEPLRDIHLTGISPEEFRARNNLLYVLKDGYNYDRPRLPNEGDDWGDTQT